MPRPFFYATKSAAQAPGWRISLKLSVHLLFRPANDSDGQSPFQGGLDLSGKDSHDHHDCRQQGWHQQNRQEDEASSSCFTSAGPDHSHPQSKRNNQQPNDQSRPIHVDLRRTRWKDLLCVTPLMLVGLSSGNRTSDLCHSKFQNRHSSIVNDSHVIWSAL